ncbi:hypothetical protein [Collimonas sp. OK412]|uniref:hypothetical protein n=1 Tax=Collimonas sp. (strain OK412) TaxID=1801619 RepID=UPI001113CF6A|nr:hypothetical protein [Collimonas sp. OK412]
MNKPGIDDSGKFPLTLLDTSDTINDEWHANAMTRRNFRSSLGALFLAGCGSGDMASVSTRVGSPAAAVTPAPTSTPASRPPETTPPETATPSTNNTFVHPGLLHVQAEFDRSTDRGFDVRFRLSSGFLPIPGGSQLPIGIFPAENACRKTATIVREYVSDIKN